MKYCVRITVNKELTFNMWHRESSVVPVKKLLETLGDYVTEVVNKNCFYFVVVVIEDSSADNVRARIKESWIKLYPDNANAVDVMLVQCDDTPLSEVMKTIYKVYYGWESYLSLCTRMANSISSVKSQNALEYFRHISYFVAADSGCGFSQMTRSFGDFIDKLGMFEKTSGNVYERVVGNDEEKGEVKVSALIEALYNEEYYYSVVGIDISNFLTKDKYPELINLCKRLYNLQDKYVFMLRVPFLERKALKDIKAAVADVLYTEDIIIPPLTDMDIEEEIYDQVMKYDYSINNNAVDVVRERINLEKMDGRFYGFKTIFKVCQEVMWLKAQANGNHILNNDDYDPTTITIEDIQGLVPEKDSREISGWDELHELVGITEIEEKIDEIVSQIKIAKNNANMEKPCLHMRFVGAPGTGKTTVARILGKIFKEEGILRKGGFFEYAGRSLCAEYVGQTSVKTSNICRDAYGSVLFIDEAYSLYTGDGRNTDYGKEALATLIAEMENHRDDMVVIMAGYDNDMEVLMEGNVGLRSRMPYKLEFNNYSRDELSKIFISMAKKEFALEEGLEEKVFEYFNSLEESFVSAKEFGNARFVRNLYERTWAKAALRVGKLGETNITLNKSDFLLATEEKEFSEKISNARKIGF